MDLQIPPVEMVGEIYCGKPLVWATRWVFGGKFDVSWGWWGKIKIETI